MTRATLPHAGQYCRNAIQNALDVDIARLVRIFGLLPFECWCRAAGVVDKNINTPKLAQGAFCECIDIAFARHVYCEHREPGAF